MASPGFGAANELIDRQDAIISIARNRLNKRFIGLPPFIIIDKILSDNGEKPGTAQACLSILRCP
jgi:hypothetical protein